MTRMGHYRGYSSATFLFIIIGFLLTTRTSVCDDVVDKSDAGSASAKVVIKQQTKLNNGISDAEKKTPEHKIDGAEHEKITNVDDKKNEKVTSDGNRTEVEKKKQQVTMDPTVIPLAHVPSLNSGALKRAFYVFAGLSVIVLAYLMIRSFGFKKNPAQMVRKYGVLAHKQDLEMRPLPLDEDDEDDTTVFDISGLSPQRPQH